MTTTSATAALNDALGNALAEIMVQVDEPSDDTFDRLADLAPADWAWSENHLQNFLATMRAALIQRASDWCRDEGLTDITEPVDA